MKTFSAWSMYLDEDFDIRVSGDTALRLGQFLGTGAEFRMNLQKLYEFRPAEDECGERIKDCRRLPGR